MTSENFRARQGDLKIVQQTDDSIEVSETGPFVLHSPLQDPAVSAIRAGRVGDLHRIGLLNEYLYEVPPYRGDTL